ncbi:MAG: histidine kinase [Treponema sp. CETP13]|nr:MAG: histidine kinase [Treponema sp. CETP13]
MSKDLNKTVVYSALEVANICGVVNQTAINWIRNGYLSAFSTPGGQYRVYQDNLINFMTERKMRIPADLMKDGDVDNVSRSILIVEDEKGLNSVIANYLEEKLGDVQVFQAYDGFEAGALLADKKPRCVIMDLNIPGIDGFNLCSKIRDSNDFGKPQVYVITSLTDEGIEKKVKDLGATEFFQKPIDMEDLADKIKKYSGF